MFAANNIIQMLRNGQMRDQAAQQAAGAGAGAPVPAKPGFGFPGAQGVPQGLPGILGMLQKGKPMHPGAQGLLGGRMGPIMQRPGFGGLGGSFGQYGMPNQGAGVAAMQGMRERGMFGLGGRR